MAAAAATLRCSLPVTQSTKSAPMGDQTLQPHLQPRDGGLAQIFTMIGLRASETQVSEARSSTRALGSATTVAGPKFTANKQRTAQSQRQRVN